jgi:hypothetical protein
MMRAQETNMAKRKSIDFTGCHTIEIMQSFANKGQFWSQIVYSESTKPTVVWEQPDLSETRADALTKAEDELDRLTERWLEEETCEA